MYATIRHQIKMTKIVPNSNLPGPFWYFPRLLALFNGTEN